MRQVRFCLHWCILDGAPLSVTFGLAQRMKKIAAIVFVSPGAGFRRLLFFSSFIRATPPAKGLGICFLAPPPVLDAARVKPGVNFDYLRQVR